MPYYVIAFVFLFLAICFAVVAIALRKRANAFANGKRYGKAVVVGYDSGEGSPSYSLLVKLPELNDGKLYNCSASRKRLAKYPVGAVVDVAYAPVRVFGITAYDVRLAEDSADDRRGVARAFAIVAFAMGVAAVAFCVRALAGA